MSHQKIIAVAALLVLGLTLIRLSGGTVQRNVAHLAISNALSDRFASSTSIMLLRTGLEIDCGTRPASECAMDDRRSDNEVIQAANQLMLEDAPSVEVIQNSASIPIGRFSPAGLSDLLQNVDTPGVLFGAGYFQIRLFLMSEKESCWQIAVRAKHDDPPPVLLDVWLDSSRVGTISYDLGDQSWDTRAVNVVASPNFHWLRLWFANDYIDKELGLDRNAYIENVEITRVEDADCAL